MTLVGVVAARGEGRGQGTPPHPCRKCLHRLVEALQGVGQGVSPSLRPVPKLRMGCHKSPRVHLNQGAETRQEEGLPEAYQLNQLDLSRLVVPLQ